MFLWCVLFGFDNGGKGSLRGMYNSCRSWPVFEGQKGGHVDSMEQARGQEVGDVGRGLIILMLSEATVSLFNVWKNSQRHFKKENDTIWFFDCWMKNGLGGPEWKLRQLGGYSETEPSHHWAQPFPIKMDLTGAPDSPSELVEEPGLEPWFNNF